ncbi:RNA ligase family protein [Paenibacillus chondroitinus]|uniref:DNA ligase (ATP) n=1 Tax=Paenibacillus chondroitinus TaxID=59842 RepID=A0ABU6DJ97_9BACL|nr:MULTISPECIES: RNA ligase family protein [Paenibacillus]MCY9657511.1 DNA ligase [Paenibacillus anseongense]MEB4797839.1 RNA ligase family protein [Paenibacillus chondroitinus]
MKPITPFEPVTSDSIPIGDWRYEIKWDGTRIVTYHSDAKTRLFNRKHHERTYHYPELTNITQYCKADSVIFDGEVIALAEDGRPSFHEVMRRDMIKRIERVKDTREKVPITYMVFDILFYNGDWLINRSLSERLDILGNIVIPNENVQLVSAHTDGNALFKVIQQQGMEGIICKQLNSTYTLNGKDERWRKVKNYGDIIAVIGGFTLRGGVVNALLLGQYDADGKLWYIGHAGTGKLTKADWRNLTDVLRPDVINEKPFTNKPDRNNDAFWVKPHHTVKVQYSEWRWKERRSLRQPSIQAFIDVPAVECKLPWI